MRNQTLLTALIFFFLSGLVFAQSNPSANSTLNLTSNSLLNATINSSSASSAVSANSISSRNCSFVLRLNTLPAYERLGDITINYTLQKQTSKCDVDTLSGNIIIMQVNNSSIILAQNLTANNVSTTAQKNDLVFGTDQFTNTTYSATVAFNFNGVISTSSKQFTLLNPQNLTLTSLNSHFSITQSSPVTLRFSTTNIGEFTSGNFTLFLNITGFTGASSAFSGEYNESSLSPFQNTTLSITIPNATQESGGYKVSAFETYKVGNETRTSNIAASLYSVESQLGAAGGSNANQFSDLITSIPNLQITTAPLMTSVALGSPTISLIGLQNTGNALENIKLSFPPIFNSFFSLSTSKLYIPPNQQSTLQIYVNPNSTVSPGTYIIPLTLNVNISNIHTIKTEYFSLNIYAPTSDNLQIVNQVTMASNITSARGILQLINPTTTPVYNFTLQTFIPINASQNASDIITTGLQANITNSSSFYIITWHISALNPLTTVYGYYTISNSMNQGSLQKIQNVMAIPSSPSQSSILKVVNIAFPTFYTNSSENIPIFVLYTGKNAQPITFTMTAPSGITVRNFSQVIVANPNQLLSPVFNVTTDQNPGTYLLNLYISTQGFNTSYTLPLIVLSNQQSGPSGSSGPTTTTNSPFFFIQVGSTTLPIFGVSGIVVIAGIIIYLIKRFSSRPRYNRQTSEQLVRLREQIKRSEKDK